MKSSLIFLLISLTVSNSTAQVNKENTLVNFKKHVEILAADSLEGRMTGTAGEEKAFNYISSIYSEIGLTPKGSDKYLQQFSFTPGRTAKTKGELSINGIKKELNKDYFILPFSSNASIEGLLAFAGFGIVTEGHNDYNSRKELKDKILIIDASLPDGYHPHSKYLEHADLKKRAETAAKYGAKGVIFFSKDPHNPLLLKEYQKSSVSIPAIFMIGSVDDLKGKTKLSVDIVNEEKTGHNVIGYINNNKPNTIIIGAHYDHLGYGEIGSLYKGEKAIHNGADDNASGVAIMMELARVLKDERYAGSNYLFIAFSGEEMGLFGSNYFSKNPTLDLNSINYMINLDMVGRLDSNKGLAINGVGTSTKWSELIDTSKVIFKVITTTSGIGPSDHTSFYLKDIPVLHFFTGTHQDYHKPSDDPHLINYEGMYEIKKFILSLIEKSNQLPKLDFQKTKEENNNNVPRFTVTLGVVPDYLYSGEGMRIDGVSDGKPAAKAGLEVGDIVVQLGEYDINDMMSYMKALSEFKKGDKTKIKVIRNNELRNFNIEF